MANDKVVPAQATEPESEPPERRRTVLVWLIFVWTCFSVLSVIISIVVISLGLQPGGAQAPQLKVTPAQQVVSLGTAVVFFAGGLALFNLRARAVKLALIALLISVVGGLYNTLSLRFEDLPAPAGLEQTWGAGIRGLTIGSLALGWAIQGAVLAYALRLRRRGMLR
jgi:hypothetical protein